MAATTTDDNGPDAKVFTDAVSDDVVLEKFGYEPGQSA